MNASRPPFSTTPRVAAWFLAVGACAALGGCVGNPFGSTKVDPTSPVAADVERLSRQGGKFPTFASIPNKPKDLRPVAQYGRNARNIQSVGEALIQATEPGTWTLEGTDAFAAKAQRDAGPSIEPGTPGESEEFAKKLRERATPPPPR